MKWGMTRLRYSRRFEIRCGMCDFVTRSNKSQRTRSVATTVGHDKMARVLGHMSAILFSIKVVTVRAKKPVHDGI